MHEFRSEGVGIEFSSELYVFLKSSLDKFATRGGSKQHVQEVRR